MLNFDDHSTGDTLAHFARGLTEDLIHRLAQVDVLEVVSRHGVKPYRSGDVTLDSIARALRPPGAQRAFRVPDPDAHVTPWRSRPS